MKKEVGQSIGTEGLHSYQHIHEAISPLEAPPRKISQGKSFEFLQTR